MRKVKFRLPAVIVCIVLAAGAARAQSCQALLNDLVNHAATQNGNDNFVAFQMVGNREASDWAQYTTGTLRYQPGHWSGYLYFPPRFSGEATQYFSDRVWTEPPPPGGLFGTAHPFSPYATDKLRVSFNLSLFNPLNYGNLTYTLLSWGNASSTVKPQCQGNYLYAFLDDQMLVFTFKKMSVPIPR